MLLVLHAIVWAGWVVGAPDQLFVEAVHGSPPCFHAFAVQVLSAGRDSDGRSENLLDAPQPSFISLWRWRGRDEHHRRHHCRHHIWQASQWVNPPRTNRSTVSDLLPLKATSCDCDPAVATAYRRFRFCCVIRYLLADAHCFISTSSSLAHAWRSIEQYHPPGAARS